MQLSILQFGILLVLAWVVACISWTVTHEEIFREPREACQKRCNDGWWFKRKFFYVFTCEYCFSHYVTFGILVLTRFKLIFNDWRGYIIAFFALVWVANHSMSIYIRLRLEIKSTNLEDRLKEQELKSKEGTEPR